MDNRGYPTKHKYDNNSERHIKVSFKKGGKLPTAQKGKVTIGDKTYDTDSEEYKKLYLCLVG